MADLNRRYEELLEQEKSLNERQEELNMRVGKEEECVIEEIPWQEENQEEANVQVKEITSDLEKLALKGDSKFVQELTPQSQEASESKTIVVTQENIDKLI